MSNSIIISGSGLYVPPHKISNEELVESFNTYVDTFNQQHQGTREHSSSAFIEKASGIKNRYVVDREGILDPKRMRPFIPKRSDDEPSVQCELACHAITQALENAQKKPEEVDGIIVSCAKLQRAYPGIAIEIQQALGMKGYGFDMNMGCSSTTFALVTAYNALASRQNKCIVVVTPEITTGHVNFRDRDSHFIFGDACTAIVMEHTSTAKQPGFEVIASKLITSFSNNIRNNQGFLNAAEAGNDERTPLYLFKQNGRKVFKEVIPMVEDHILSQLQAINLKPNEIRRYWLHQANINMNTLIMKKILEREPESHEAPIILNEYANTASCGSLIAFHLYHQDFKKGDLGLICSFGAGYSIGSLVLKKQ